MTLRERIEQDLTAAMKSRDVLRTSVLRMAKAAIRTKEVEKTGAHLEDVQIIALLGTLIKQRREAVEKYTLGNRPELAEKEKLEIGLIEEYLPKAISGEEIAAAVREVVAEIGASSSKDFGRVMKTVMARFSGRVIDGKLVSELVKEVLS
jgi:uncharacterized protein